MTTPTFRDLFVTTAEIARQPLTELPGVSVVCDRLAGWQLMEDGRGLVAGEWHHDPAAWLRLDVAGLVIVDSRPI